MPDARPVILYTGNFLFPTGDAAAARVLGIGKALRDLGYEIVFAGGEREGRPEDSNGNGYAYQGFPYFPQAFLEDRPATGFQRLVAFDRAGRRLVESVGERFGARLAAIFAYRPTTPLHLRLRSYARRRGIPLVLDITEWPTSAKIPGGALGPRALDSEFRMRFLNRRCDGMVVISSFLERYYAGLELVRIPPLVDLSEAKWHAVRQEFAPGSVKLIYAGTPAYKDLVPTIIRTVLEQRGPRPVELHVLGLNDQELAACAPALATPPAGTSRVVCHGRIPQEEVPAALAGADFSVLLRRPERYADAGFPTKLVESISAGTPAIVNPTSDIAEYVRDGSEGVLVDGCSDQAFARALARAVAISPEKIAEMKSAARRRAQEVFDYRAYVGPLQRFLAAVGARPA